ncbi:MAG: glycoside hydrolase family 127 protein [Sphingosinicella sp.]|nr:glycoside hydrolase family 127 protein [Sphingosinicella sp.]
MSFNSSGPARLGGVLGEALDANHRGRLSRFVVDESSPAIALFGPEAVAANEGGDWYGEHSGKWLVAATRAAVRAGDAELIARAQRVADWLIARQETGGYLGNYPPERRFMVKQPPKPFNWDGAPALRTWDIWTHSYLILGFVELHRATEAARYLAAARRIGDLAFKTLSSGDISITDLGNHFGLSATILIDPAVELYEATGEQHYLDLALLLVEQAERDPRSAFLSAALADADPSEIATGKAYQLLWNLVGLAKLYRATSDERYLTAVRNIWARIRAHHLTLGGGPWGGVAHRSREIFNPAAVFDPHGYVETCSTMAWIQLNRQLLEILGEAEFAQEIERTAYNDLIGAQAPDGEDWCYYSFPNGRRTHTTYWRCCKSSGAMALEELPAIAYGVTRAGALSVNLLGPSKAVVILPGAGAVSVRQEGDYPFGGDVSLVIEPEREAEFTVQVRVPDWADGGSVSVTGEASRPAVAGEFASITRRWAPGDRIILSLPMTPSIHRAVSRNVQESLAPDGSPVAQEVMRYDYVAFTLGPFTYATGLIDGYRTSDILRAEPGPADIRAVPASNGLPGYDLELRSDRGAVLIFEPYYRAGGRQHGSWRLSWMGLAPSSGSTL